MVRAAVLYAANEPMPILMGHAGAGVVAEVGDGVPF